MGYTIEFKGAFSFSRELTLKEKNELDAINDKDWRDDHTRPDPNSYYCQWISNEDDTQLEWDGSEKFYGYIEWLNWLIDNFFKPKGIKLNGTVNWYGEDHDDVGKIIVTNNDVKILEGKISYKGKE